jgi:TonB family protein
LAARREQRRKEYQQDYTATPYADDRAKLKDYSAGSDKLTEDAAKNYGEQLEDSWFKKLEKITGTYPEEACLFKEVEGQAIVGAVVRSDGKVMGDAIVLQSSGYKGLDQAAVKEIEARKFTTEELGEFKEGKAYRMVEIPVSFQPTEAECKEDPVQPIS